MRRLNLYYSLKPFIPRALRLAFRRYSAKKLRQHCTDTWPIDESAGSTPENWLGWPEGKKFAFVITHDVEGQNGLEKSYKLANLEKEAGFRSSFNFIPEGEYSTSVELREDLISEGFEVGVHDLRHDGKLYLRRELFRENANRINQYVKEWEAHGFRSGFMLRELEWLHDLNIEYDASTFDTDPFEPQPNGVRTIFPYWINKNEMCSNESISHNCEIVDGYVEMPYTLAQDSTLFLILREKTIDIWKNKIDWIVNKGGMVLVNVHPDYIDFGDSTSRNHTYPVSLYLELLEYIKSINESCWHALPHTVADHYRSMLLKTSSKSAHF